MQELHAGAQTLYQELSPAHLSFLLNQAVGTALTSEQQQLVAKAAQWLTDRHPHLQQLKEAPAMLCQRFEPLMQLIKDLRQQISQLEAQVRQQPPAAAAGKVAGGPMGPDRNRGSGSGPNTPTSGSKRHRQISPSPTGRPANQRSDDWYKRVRDNTIKGSKMILNERHFDEGIEENLKRLERAKPGAGVRFMEELRTDAVNGRLEIIRNMCGHIQSKLNKQLQKNGVTVHSKRHRH